MKLQILINHYRESPELIGRLLQSIAEQNVKDDFSVMIASDGEEHALERVFLDSFPFDIDYHILPHKGTRATRNTLLDMATADYLMFCDADDCFGSPEGISKLFNTANDGNPDVVSVPFIAEIKDGYKYKYVRIPNNGIWIQGKLFRRQYLLENQIRFDEIADHGEMSFLWLSLRLTKNIRYLQETFYVWKWNDESDTRSDPFYSIRNYGKMLMSYALLAENLTERQRQDLRNELIAEMISAVYIDSETGRLNDAPPELVKSAKTAIAEFVGRYRTDYAALDKRFQCMKYNAALVGRRTYGPSGKFVGITAWMDSLAKG